MSASALTRRTALLLRPSMLTPLRTYATPPSSSTPPPSRSPDQASILPDPFEPPTSTGSPSRGAPSPPRPDPSKPENKPLPSPSPIFPAPSNPFEPPRPPPQKKEYSETTKTVLRGVARLMGYNSRATTAIRETSRMMKMIVECVERDKEFWYNDCSLPPTYQTFFQLHLLYVLILLPRLRALPANLLPRPNQFPEPILPAHHQTSPSSPSTSTPEQAGEEPGESKINILSKPNYQSYPTELLNHFFELAESQMRRVLGQNERERVVKQYMKEMGEQWRGAGVALDYVLGLTSSQEAAEVEKADAELASWLWRNLFAARGLRPPAPPGVEPERGGGVREVEMAEQLSMVVRFVRREMSRLESVHDEDVIGGEVGRFGHPWDQ